LRLPSTSYCTRRGAARCPQRACKPETRSLKACCVAGELQESTQGLTQSLWHEGAHGDRPQHSTAHAVCLSAAAQALTCASPEERGTSKAAAAITAIRSSVRLTDKATSNAPSLRAPQGWATRRAFPRTSS